MPEACFSYTPDAPLKIRRPGAVPRDIGDCHTALSGNPTGCFSYSSDMPPGTGIHDEAPETRCERGVAGPCFNFSAGVPIGNLRRMPNGSPSGCFTYPGDVPVGIANRGITPRPGLGVRRMPGEVGPCFSYYP
jgi:hypothetical protein